MSHPSSPSRRQRPNTDAPPAPINIWPAWQATFGQLGYPPDEQMAAVIARLVCTFTSTGDLLVAFHRQQLVARAADWYARKAALVTDSDRAENFDRALQTILTPTRRAAVRVIQARPGQHAALLERAPESAAMIIMRWPVEVHEPAGGDEEVFAAAATALKPGGFLCVEVADLDADYCYTDQATQVIAMAQAAGLTFHQHIPVIHERPLERDLAPGPWLLMPEAGPRTHRPDHIDLYIFATAGGFDA